MKRRILAAAASVLLAFVAVLGLGARSALAYTAVNGTSVSFDKYLIVEEDAKIPAITFEYEITPGVAVQATSSTPAVMAGVGTPQISTNAVFANDDPTYTAVQEPDAVTLDSGEKYAKTQATIDFSTVAFSQPGIYRYVITEQTSTDNKAVSYDTQNTGAGATARMRYLDVYVVDNANTLTVTAYVLHTTTAASVVANTGDSVSDKSKGFVNEISSHNLTFGKEVVGNQGSKDKYFRFTLEINGAQANTTYAVDLANAEANPDKTDATIYNSMTNQSAITTRDHGMVTEYFYLKDGQYVTIKGLPEGCTYTVTEEKEDYTSTSGIEATNGKGGEAYTDAVSNTTGITADVKTGYTNTRTGTVPTGVILTVAPFAIGLMLFGALTVLFVSKSLRRSV